MPESARSVQSLNTVLEKSGSFASIQIVAQSEDPKTTHEFLKKAKSQIDSHDWVAYSQYSEDVEFLTRHRLLMLETEELEALEQDIKDAYPVFLAQKLAEAVGTDVTLSIRDQNAIGSSTTELDQHRINDLTESLSNPPAKERFFTTEDELTGVLVIWPKNGLDSLGEAKHMVGDARVITEKLIVEGGGKVKAGVAGRIANKVAQFDAVTGDLKLSLISAISLIALLIGLFNRSLISVPIIILPLGIGLIWTLGLTSLVIGGLNLITVFLVLILFGLGIDFGIHNFSRYIEERRNGAGAADAIAVVVSHTGVASLIAALTTSAAFFALMLTQFRAFSEFGFIAGAGVILIFAAMYSVQPAMIVVLERFLPQGVIAPWANENIAAENPSAATARNYALPIVLLSLVFAAAFVPRVSFERNFKNLEARQPSSLVWATMETDRVFGSSHDRALLAVDTLTELSAVTEYFDEKILTDLRTPTIEKTSSVLEFIPLQDLQLKRLAIIDRLNERAESLRGVDDALYESAMNYLDIDTIDMGDLPEALRRAYLGADREPGYLFYIYNSVSMDDSALAKQFYDDAASFEVSGKRYFSASEGFIFVEMIALMKADALKAIVLVSIVTAFLALLFTRRIAAAVIILTPPLLGVLVTLGIMGAVGLPLSIMNMVILPSLIGITVDNSIHIYHRFKTDGEHYSIAAIMRSTGRAAVLTTLTTLIGFGGLVTASMGGLQSMGMLAIIGFSICLIFTWLLIPGLLRFLQTKPRSIGGSLVCH
ncbi:MAG: MMPL family transporter [Marinicaulis sp.]|nr:MMPL family transporter [Marinicaulis sp.]